MNHNQTTSFRQLAPWYKSLLALSLLVGFTAIISCKAEPDEAALTILGSDGGYTYFKGDLNMDLMSDCGSATAQSSTGSGSNSTNKDIYDIEAYYMFTYGETIFTRFTYNNQKTTFTLQPTQSGTSQCQTSDGIKCDGVGALTCETSDSINCGGTKSFMFSGGWPVSTVFQAKSGTIDYQGTVIDDKAGVVTNADLKFKMVDAKGQVLEGELHCYAPN